MNTNWGVMVMFALSGCGSSGTSAKEKQICDHAAKLCDAQDSVKECYSDLAETKKAMGNEYDKFLSCGGAAKTCGEFVGCAIGGVGGEALDQLEGVGKGMQKMMKDKLEDLPERVGHEIDGIKDRVESRVRGTDDEALPGPCPRIEKVCAPDEPFVRRHCRRLVQNLGEDKTYLGELSTCISEANNCYALKACIDKLEDKLRGF